MNLRKVPVNSILFGFLMLFYITPGFIESTIVTLIRNALFAVTIVYLFKKKYKPSSMIVCSALYLLFLLGVTFYNQTDVANVGLVIFNAKIIVFMAVLDDMITRRYRDTITVAYYIMLLFVGLNLITIITMPEGVYQMTTDWGIWGGVTRNPHWILGNKNTQLPWHVLFQILAFFKYSMKQNKNPLVILSAILIPISAMVLLVSSTSLFAITMSSFGLLLALRKKGLIKIASNAYLILIAYLVLVALIIGGVTEFLTPIVTSLFNKDLTFSSRTTIWQEVLIFIMQHPIIGSGEISGAASGELLDNLGFVNAHNQVLNTLWQGGVCLLFLGILIFICIARNVNRIKEKRYKLIIELMLVAFLIDTIFEVVAGNQATWILLYIIYKATDICQYIGRDIENSHQRIARF